MKSLITLIFVTLLLSGCGTAKSRLANAQKEYVSTPTPELKEQISALKDEVFDAEQQLGFDLENWFLCERILRDAGRPTVHIGHSHPRPRIDGSIRLERLRPWMIKDDLMYNRCHALIPGEMWAD